MRERPIRLTGVMWFALVVAIIGLACALWPEALVRGARVYRGAMPERSSRTVRAARAAGGLLIVAALLIALAEG
ncbi:MAG TPA: hypothetical protein VG899_13470 [Mycobacteriales bacterium]|nr:hypothetical protein [Mycobacteriales bacterium]